MGNLVQWPIKDSDDNGEVLAGGQLYSYYAGTSTPKALYTDSACTVEATNPIVLTAGGRAVDASLNAVGYMGAGYYKLVMKDADDNIVWQADNIAGGNGGEGMAIVETIADLRALAEGAYAAVYVLGYTTAGDGGGGWFRWNDEDTDSDDNGVVILPDTSPSTGRWNRINFDHVNIRFFGATGDGSTDDTTAVSDANSYADSAGMPLYAPAGAYALDSDPGMTEQIKLDPAAKFVWSGINPTIYPVIAADDMTHHFDCVTEDAPVLADIESTRPEHFGAVANGTTNDAPAIDVCIAAIPDQQGVRIEFQPGATYAVSSTSGIEIDSRSQLIFNGNGAKIKKITEAGPVLTFKGCSHISINHLQVIGNSEATNGMAFIENDEDVACSQIKVNDVYIEECDVGIALGNVNDQNEGGITDSWFANLHLVDNAIQVSSYSGSNTGISFYSCHFEGDPTICGIVVSRGDIDFYNPIVDGLDAAAPTWWFWAVSDGSIRVYGGKTIADAGADYGLLLIGGQTEAYVAANPNNVRRTEFHNHEFRSIGTDGYSDNTPDNTIICMANGCRDLALMNCKIGVLSTDSPVAGNVVVKHSDSGILLSVGNKYWRYSTWKPWSGIDNGNVDNFGELRSVNDAFFTWEDDGSGNYIESVVQQGDIIRTDITDADINALTLINSSKALAGYGKYVAWQKLNGSNYQEDLGKIGYCTDDDDNANLRVYVGDTKVADSDGGGFAAYGRFSQHGTTQTITSASNISLGDSSFAAISGTTQISRIDSTGWGDGSVITLRFIDNVKISNNAAASSEYKPITFPDPSEENVKFAHSGEAISFVYDENVEKWLALENASRVHTRYGDTITGVTGVNTKNAIICTGPGNVFKYTDTVDHIDLIKKENWIPGDHIIIDGPDTAVLTVKDESGAETGYADIHLATGTQALTHIIGLMYDGTAWYEMFRNDETY